MMSDTPETHEGYPRHREDVDEAIRKMNLSMESEPRSIRRKLLNFQVFVAVLLLALVLITSLSFGFAMRADRESRESAEIRQVLFEDHVTSILDSIEISMQRGVEQRTEIQFLLDELRDELRRHDER